MQDNMLTLFNILSFGERIIVHSVEEDKQIYTWNQSLTLQCWEEIDGYWQEVDIRTLMDTPGSFREAKKAAEHWAWSSEFTMPHSP